MSEEQLNENLPIALIRKPIRKPQNPKPRLPLESQTSTTSEEREEDDTQILCGVQPKRIRYLSPINYFVIEDGHTFPNRECENFAPIYMMKLSNKVERVIFNRKNGDLIYSIMPKFGVSDIVPWQMVTEKLKREGDRDCYELATILEDFTKERNIMAPVFKTDPEIVSTFDTLKDETLSDTIPQIAEVRVLRDYPYRHFAVVKYVMNKAMQEFIGLNTSDTVSCLQTGMKLPKIAKGDSIDFSKNYYRFYIKQFQEKFKKAREEQLVNSTTRFNIEGIPLETNITCRLSQYGGEVAWIYSYHVGRKKPQQPADASTNSSDSSTNSSTSLQISKSKKPQIGQMNLTEEERAALQQYRQAALAFGKRFAYPCKYIREEPPQDRVCRIKHLTEVNNANAFATKEESA